MKDIIRWFVILLHKDMQNFEMDESAGNTIYRKIWEQMEKDSTK